VKKVYLKQIQDTPRNTCAICEEFHFSHNIGCFTQYLKQEYIILIENEKTLSYKNICIPCKRELQNGKLTQFATPEQIRCNMPLQIVSTLSKLEDILISLRITLAQIRQLGYKRSQMGLNGSIINAHVHMDVVQKELP